MEAGQLFRMFLAQGPQHHHEFLGINVGLIAGNVPVGELPVLPHIGELIIGLDISPEFKFSNGNLSIRQFTITLFCQIFKAI